MSQFDSRRNGSRNSGTSTDRTAQLSVGKRTQVEERYGGLPSSTPEAPKPAMPPGGSASLPAPVQAKMESAFQADFSDVAIHADSQQATDAGAQAFARGNEIHFAPGNYQPGSHAGQELLGHELAHVVQQRQGRVSDTAALGKAMAVNDDAALEREADDMGARAARGEATGAGAAAGNIGAGVVQRKPYRPIPRPGMPVWLKDRSTGTLVERKVESYDASSRKVKLEGTLAPVDEQALEYSRPLGGNHMAEESPDEEWRGRPDPKPRSRYTFAPLVANKMIVTLTMQKSQAAGHSHVAFEWWDPFSHASRHHVFEFNPKRTAENQEHTLVDKTKGVPGEVQEHTDRNYLPNRKDDKPIDTSFRSWEVPYEAGKQGVGSARGLQELAQNDIVTYQLLGGDPAKLSYNCHTMAKKLAEDAGVNVDAGILDALLGSVPAAFSGFPLDGTEAEMAARATS